MAHLNANYITLLDIAKRQKSDKSIADVVEILAAINDDEHRTVARETLRRTLAKAVPMRVRLSGEKYSHA